MPTCRCKMCGGQIHYGENDSTAVCEFCGTEQTVVRTDDLKQLNLFNRANSLRLQNEFDKAQTTYENILIDDPNNAEAHWGICLCRYGIEYVDDKKTNKKVPTCHRTVYKFIYDDIDYLAALDNADVVAKKVYESEAKVIDKIQKNILAISQKEDPYDIFICYKETDEIGNRTKDSVVAQDIYDELIRKGYKVFFSRITLESKIGSDYEPIIFAALMSSKVMLAIGSKPEYFNAPWVKNEWGRFLSFMKDQQGKYLIPCYFDMEAYDMPEEFLMLQAQDIGKIGYLQDLSRGIDKLFGNDNKQKTTVKVEYSNSQISNMFKRVNILLNESDFDGADTVIENILNIDLECAEAYFYKVLTEKRAKNVEALIELGNNISDNKNYIRALKYASDEYKNYLQDVCTKISEKANEINRKGIISSALAYMDNNKFDDAIKCLKLLPSGEEVDGLLKDCYEGCYKKAISNMEIRAFEKSISLFELIIDYRDSKEQIEECKKQIDIDTENNRYQHIRRSLEDLFKSIKTRKYIKDDDDRIFNKNIKVLESMKYGSTQASIVSYQNRFSELKRTYPRTTKGNQTNAQARTNKRLSKWEQHKNLYISLIVIGAIVSLILLIIIVNS